MTLESQVRTWLNEHRDVLTRGYDVTHHLTAFVEQVRNGAIEECAKEAMSPVDKEYGLAIYPSFQELIAKAIRALKTPEASP